MNNLFKSAIPFAVLALLSFGSTAFAEDEEESADSVEEVVVTGSRISRTSNYDATGPVDVFTAQDVIDSGKTNIGDFLIELPSANLSSNATNQRSVNNGNTGTTELLIRTSGEKRISNFLLWQLAYSEIYISDVLWPDFTEIEFLKAIIDYQSRNRRFGGIESLPNESFEDSYFSSLSKND